LEGSVLKIEAAGLSSSDLLGYTLERKKSRFALVRVKLLRLSAEGALLFQTSVDSAQINHINHIKHLFGWTHC